MTTMHPATKANQLKTLGRALLFYSSSVVVFIISSIIAKNAIPRGANLDSMLIATVLSIWLVLLFTNWEKLNALQVGIIPRKGSLGRFLMGFIGGIAMAGAQLLVLWLYGHIQLSVSPHKPLSATIFSVILFTLAATREEIVFRSYFLRSLARVLHAPFALTIVTIAFVGEHIASGQNWLSAVIGVGLGGFLYGVAALRTKGLALPLGLHLAWNLGQWILGFKDNTGAWQIIVNVGFERKVQAIALAAFAAITLIAIVLVFVSTKPRKT